jgi:hypothetical protein
MTRIRWREGPPEEGIVTAKHAAYFRAVIRVSRFIATGRALFVGRIEGITGSERIVV